MSNDQAFGVVLLLGSVVGVVIYGWLVFFTGWALLILQFTGFIAMAFLLGVLGWIGYTLASTPPPKTIEDIEKELEEADDKPPRNLLEEP